jgi:hypothetical protein
MEAAETSGTLIIFYKTTWRYSPEGGHLHTYGLQNLKPYFAAPCSKSFICNV